jgi:hypothetical protein
MIVMDAIFKQNMCMSPFSMRKTETVCAWRQYPSIIYAMCPIITVQGLPTAFAET